MEANGSLDPLNEHHLFASDYIYSPDINIACEELLQQLNNRHMRTAINRSPVQVFTHCCLELYGSHQSAIRDLYNFQEDQFMTGEI